MDLSKDSSPVAQGGAASDSQFDRLTRLFEAIDNAPQVTIACIQGPAFGGGVGLAFACDIRIMAKGASMTLSETRLGLAPATISKYVTREWGAAFTREAILTARTVSTTELKELGAVHEVVEPASTLPAVVDGYLIRLKGVAPHASALGKELVRLSWRDGGGGQAQANGIRHVFDDMMSATSESAFGLKQFQARKTVDWDEFQLSRHVPKALL
jgi:hydroxymethylglutaryl-CoA lyase